VIGGRAILAIDPTALQRLSAGRTVVLVSGTNGKTTTTAMLRAALATRGAVVTNLLGANLPPGLAMALAAGPAGVPAVLEVDEAWLGQVVAATDPAVAVLLNLSRDQLDRNNEVRQLADKWRAALSDRPGLQGSGLEVPGLRVVANADDPMVVWGAGTARRVTWVGAGQPWRVDAAGCPCCGGRIHFEDEAGEMGWACASCGFRRPPLDLWLERGEVVLAGGRRIALDLHLPGRCNQANAALALAAALHLGIGEDAAAAAIGGLSEVAGRYRTVTVGGVRARLLLAKNPAGWLEVFDLLAPPPGPVVVAINAHIADGRDPSWLWDVPFERLRGRLVVATGERSRDLAVRLRYAEVEHRREPDLVAAIAAAGQRDVDGPKVDVPEVDVPEVDVVANYTSFQALTARLDRAA
jgi:UDP-N-acetylmuramyl tripeptide synthase